MFKRLLFVFAALVVLLLALFPVVASAQEVTAEPTVEATETPTPPVQLPTDAIVTNGGQLVLLFVLAAFGGGGALAIVFRFLERKDARDAAERLHESLSPNQQEVFRDMIDGYREFSNRLLTFLDAATDGEPNE